MLHPGAGVDSNARMIATKRAAAPAIASASPAPPCRLLSTSSAKCRPCRLSRKARTASGASLVAAQIASTAIGQAVAACSAIDAQKPQPGLSVWGTSGRVVAVIGLLGWSFAMTARSLYVRPVSGDCCAPDLASRT